jgi:hypothetical protein
MPNHWHPVPAQNEPLNISKVERVPSRLGIGLMSASTEQMTKQASAFFALRRVFFDVLTQYLSPA